MHWAKKTENIQQNHIPSNVDVFSHFHLILKINKLQRALQRYSIKIFLPIFIIFTSAIHSAHAAVPAVMGVSLGMDWSTAVAKAKKVCENMPSCIEYFDGTRYPDQDDATLSFKSDDRQLGCMTFFMRGFKQKHGVFFITINYECFDGSKKAALTSLKHKFGATSDIRTTTRKSTAMLWTDQPLTINDVAEGLLTGGGWVLDQANKRYAIATLDSDGSETVSRIHMVVVDGALQRLANKLQKEQLERFEKDRVKKILSPL